MSHSRGFKSFIKDIFKQKYNEVVKNLEKEEEAEKNVNGPTLQKVSLFSDNNNTRPSLQSGNEIVDQLEKLCAVLKSTHNCKTPNVASADYVAIAEFCEWWHTLTPTLQDKIIGISPLLGEQITGLTRPGQVDHRYNDVNRTICVHNLLDRLKETLNNNNQKDQLLSLVPEHKTLKASP